MKNIAIEVDNLETFNELDDFIIRKYKDDGTSSDLVLTKEELNSLQNMLSWFYWEAKE
jgi:hypothetical protein